MNIKSNFYSTSLVEMIDLFDHINRDIWDDEKIDPIPFSELNFYCEQIDNLFFDNEGYKMDLEDEDHIREMVIQMGRSEQ